MLLKLNNPSSLSSWNDVQSHFESYENITCCLIDHNGALGITDSYLNDRYVRCMNKKITNAVRAKMVIAARCVEFELNTDDDFIMFEFDRQEHEIEAERLYFDKLNRYSISECCEPVSVVPSTMRQEEAEELARECGCTLEELIRRSAIYE